MANGRGSFLMHGLTKLKVRIERVRRLLWYRCDRERPLGSGMLLVVSLSYNVVLTPLSRDEQLAGRRGRRPTGLRANARRTDSLRHPMFHARVTDKRLPRVPRSSAKLR